MAGSERRGVMLARVAAVLEAALETLLGLGLFIVMQRIRTQRRSGTFASLSSEVALAAVSRIPGRDGCADPLPLRAHQGIELSSLCARRPGGSSLTEKLGSAPWTCWNSASRAGLSAHFRGERLTRTPGRWRRPQGRPRLRHHAEGRSNVQGTAPRSGELKRLANGPQRHDAQPDDVGGDVGSGAAWSGEAEAVRTLYEVSTEDTTRS